MIVLRLTTLPLPPNVCRPCLWACSPSCASCTPTPLWRDRSSSQSSTTCSCCSASRCWRASGATTFIWGMHTVWRGGGAQPVVGRWGRAMRTVHGEFGVTTLSQV